MTAQPAIPTFKLYGEDHDWPTPDLRHWESIAQRSKPHDWIIKPHRHDKLLQLIYIETGVTQARLDGLNLRIESPTLLVIPPLTIHGFEFVPETRGHVLTLAAPLVQRVCMSMGGQPNGLQKAGVIGVTRDEQRCLGGLLTAIAGEYQSHREYRDAVLQSLVSQLLIWVVRQRTAVEMVTEQTRDKGKQYFIRFQQLVERHYREHRPLDFYAAKLNISTPHLNSICRQAAGVSALRVIHERLLLEAKRDLVYTAYTIKEISDGLGFAEPAYFTRFFKRRQNVSPQEFRRLEAGLIRPVIPAA
jgi:AraC family transcriptional activator of pobA